MKTVNVRAAVAVDEEGNWSIWGEKDFDDDEMMSEVFARIDTLHTVVHFIEAEVPLPQEPKTFVAEAK
jgi:hypothetical protein